MRISVVIPLYNKEKHIKNTIETVLSQTYKDFELCIIDDGSIDNSASIVENIIDDRIRLIRKKNEGVSKTRNFGVRIAKNEIVAFMDADDEWEETYLEEIIKLIDKYPEAAIFATNYKIVERNGYEYNLTYPGINESSCKSSLIQNYFKSAYFYTPLWTSAVVIRKTVFNLLGGFPTNIKNGEDLDLWCRCALHYPIAYLNKPLAIYRRDSENMLSRSITTPSWFPFLNAYSYEEKQLIKDQESVWNYIVQRQLEAASSSLFTIRNNAMCQSILKSIKRPDLNRKKYYGLYILSFLPSIIVTILQNIKQKCFS